MSPVVVLHSVWRQICLPEQGKETKTEPGDFIEFEETESGVHGGQGIQTLQGRALAEKKLQKTT